MPITTNSYIAVCNRLGDVVKKLHIIAALSVPVLLAACGEEEKERGGYRMSAIESTENNALVERTVFSYASSGSLSRVTVYDAKGTTDLTDDVVKYYSLCAYESQKNVQGFRDLTIEYRNDRVPVQGKTDYAELCRDGSNNSDVLISEAIYTPVAPVEGVAQPDALVARLSVKKTAAGSELTQIREGETDILRKNIYTLGTTGGLQTIETTEAPAGLNALETVAYTYAFNAVGYPDVRVRLNVKDGQGKWDASKPESRIIWEYPADKNQVLICQQAYRTGSWSATGYTRYISENGRLVREEVATAAGNKGWCDAGSSFRINKIQYEFVASLR